MFFKNRSLSVKVVKDPNVNEDQSTDYVDLVNAVTKSVSTFIVVYIGADTVRQIILRLLITKL